MIPLKDYKITYPYGVKNPRYSKGYHTGVDMISDDYTVYAASTGTIMESRWTPGNGAEPNGWGNYIVVRSYNGKYDMIYAHLASVNVTRDQKIEEGAILGMMGSTGQSTGAHLHFEVRNAPWLNQNDIEPLQWLKEEGEKGFMVLILVGRGPDERAAGYLSDYLKAPVSYLDAVNQSDIDLAQKVYVVGGSTKPIERAVLISGSDRFATCQKVLDFIKNGGK